MTRIWLFFGIASILFSACVPSRKVVYLQKEDLKNRKQIPKDTILRTHDLDIREYRIQPLDMLSINFETLSEESNEFDFLSKLSPQRTGGGGNATGQSGILVDPLGEIEFPILGRLKLSGLSVFQAQDTIRKVASKYLPDVVVRVRMLNFRYTILGEVNGEKTVTVSNTRLNMMEAIGQAGGLSELADRQHIKVIRQIGDQAVVFYVNLLKEEHVESPYYFVQQNDIIIVPPLKQRTFRRYFTGNIALVTSTVSSVIAFTLLIITLSDNNRE